MPTKYGTCKECYQNRICKLPGPIFNGEGLNPKEAPPEACFGHCCLMGYRQAVQAHRDGPGEHEFGTAHKPFRNEDGAVSGRYVLNLRGTEEDGTVYLRKKDGEIIILTNILRLRPPRD